MLRYVAVFLLLWGFIALGLSTWRRWTKSGAISAAKALGLGFISAVAATTILVALVTFF